MTRSISAIFTRKYVLVLGLLFAVSLAAFFVFGQLLRVQVSPEIMNLSSRERMLTHRIALYAVLLVDPGEKKPREEVRRLLADAVADLETGHQAIRAQTASSDILRWGWFADGRLSAQLAELDASISSLIADARAVLARPEGDPLLRRLVPSIVDRATRDLSQNLDDFLGTFETINREQGEYLHVFALVGEGVTIALLIFSGLWVFRPLVRDIDTKIRQISHLENYYSAIIDNVGDGVIAFDKTMTIGYVNSTVEAMWRRMADDLVGRPIGEVLPEVAAIDKLFAVPRRRSEFMHQKPDGTNVIFDASIYVLKFEGDLQCIVSLRDITERKDLEDRLRTFFYGIEHSPMSIVITDTHGVIEYANRRCAEVSGYALQEIVGQTPRIFRSGQTPPEVYQELWTELMAGRDWYGEILNRRKNGDLYWEFEAISAIKNEEGAVTHFIAIKEDITEKKRQAAALIETKRASEVANRSKSEFLANMSHELRTPLNAIIGFAEIMKMELYGAHAIPTYREYSLAVFDSARHLLGIINDILDFSKLEAGKVELSVETVGVRDLVQSVLVFVKDRADSTGVRLDVVESDAMSQLPGINVDPLRLKQVLLNIVGNAIKFTPRGGTVSVEAVVNEDGGLSLLVKDTGIGMSEDDIPRALERFGQVDASLTRRYEGTGLGLPISKTLIELHGGTLRLTSKEGQGTTAIITLPADRVIHEVARAATPD
ncbi:MAG: PAS domain S-box protein [Alphaproteobacteria bacterium]|nr:PAS domain S-box protein [Alphaproteobacteria bacterium]